MVRKKRKTQEEEILEVLEREGFTEVPENELKREPYKSISSWPECVAEASNQNYHKKKSSQAA